MIAPQFSVPMLLFSVCGCKMISMKFTIIFSPPQSCINKCRTRFYENHTCISPQFLDDFFFFFWYALKMMRVYLNNFLQKYMRVLKICKTCWRYNLQKPYFVYCECNIRLKTPNCFSFMIEKLYPYE